MYNQIACFQGKEGKTTDTPKSLPGVCGGPRHTILVYKFGRPLVLTVSEYGFAYGSER